MIFLTPVTWLKSLIFFSYSYSKQQQSDMHSNVAKKGLSASLVLYPKDFTA